MEKIQEMFIKDPRKTKEQTEMNNILKEINSRITEVEEQINDLEDTVTKINQSERQTEIQTKKMKAEEATHG